MTEDKAHILVVDDDQRIRELIGRYLRAHDLLVSAAADSAEARRKMKGLMFDLIVLDVMMPGEDGISLLRDLSRNPLKPPILMLTALSKTEERIDGLEAGADDYLTKPFEPKELLLRVQNLLSRTRPSGIHAIKMGAFTFDDGVLTENGQRIPLSASETDLLSLLARAPGRIFSRAHIADSCALETERAVDVRINRLRNKIEADPHHPLYLQTARGLGYVLKPER